MARPYWSGHIQISLVSFGVQLFVATEAASEIHFHQLDRKTGERVRHQNVSGDHDSLDKDEIVKGYEYSKGEYVAVEQEDIDSLRIPSRQTLAITQCVDQAELDPKFYEKPYFVTPENPAQAEAFAVVRKALQSTGKVALGKIAFGGREHLVAIAAPADDSSLGMMAYTMRYADELRDPAEYFGSMKQVAIDGDQLALAKELIDQKSSKFDPAKYKDEYETALRAMVEAKIKHLPLPKNGTEIKSEKVVNLMDALRKSVAGNDSPTQGKYKKVKEPAKSTTKSEQPVKLSLVNKESKSKIKAAKPGQKRKSA